METLYVKYEWPDIQEYMEEDGFYHGGNVSFSATDNCWFVKKEWRDSVDKKRKTIKDL